MAISAVAVTIAGASLGVFGALRSDDPSAQSTRRTTPSDLSTTIPQPRDPTLEELVPGVTDKLVVIAERNGTTWTLLWYPWFQSPKEVRLDDEDVDVPGAARSASAVFDSGTRYLAVTTCDDRVGGSSCEVRIGSMGDLPTDPYITDAVSFIWNAREVGRMAWIEQVAGADYAVLTGTLNPFGGSIDDVSMAVPLPGAARLVQWDADGFVLVRDDGTGETLAYGPDGGLRWSTDGMATSGAASIVAISDGAGAWRLIDRITGEPLASDDIDSEAMFVTTSNSSDLVATLVETSGAGPYVLTVTGGGIEPPSRITVSREHAPIGFTNDGAYFVFAKGDRTLAFADWNRGIVGEVEIPPGYEVIGFSLS